MDALRDARRPGTDDGEAVFDELSLHAARRSSSVAFDIDEYVAGGDQYADAAAERRTGVSLTPTDLQSQPTSAAEDEIRGQYLVKV